MKRSVGRAFSSETTPSFVSFTRSSLGRVEGSKQWKPAYDGILGWKPGGEQAVERRGPGGIRHTGRFLQPRLSHHNFHNLKHCLSTPQILIHPPERNWFDISGCNQRRYWRTAGIEHRAQYYSSVVWWLAAQLMKLGRERRDKAIIRCRAGSTAAEI